MKVLMIRSSHENSNIKKKKSIFYHFCPVLPVRLTICPIKQCGTLCKVDPPPSGAPWATFYTAKWSTTLA